MSADVIVVLSGGIRQNGELHQTTQKRIEKAKELFDKGAAPAILMTGKWSLFREDQPKITEAEAMTLYAESLGVPSSVLWQEKNSTSTLSNALYTKVFFLEPHNWKKVIVVTSDFHCSRANMIFSAVLGTEYEIDYAVVSTHVHFSLYTKRWLKESILLPITQKYLLNFGYDLAKDDEELHIFYTKIPKVFRWLLAKYS